MLIFYTLAVQPTIF